MTNDASHIDAETRWLTARTTRVADKTTAHDAFAAAVHHLDA